MPMPAEQSGNAGLVRLGSHDNGGQARGVMVAAAMAGLRERQRLKLGDGLEKREILKFSKKDGFAE